MSNVVWWSHVKCRVTEYMNGSSVHEWFLNNYDLNE